MSADAVSRELERYVADLVASGAIRSDRVRRAFLGVLRHRFLDHWYRMESDRQRVTWHRVDFDPDHPSDEALRHIYSNQPLVTRIEGMYPISSMSEPGLAATMLEALDVSPGMRVLEIGTGTGYNAALLGEALADPGGVYSVEVRDDVAREAADRLGSEGYGKTHVVCSDGFHGVPDGAPYERIIVTVGCPDIAPAWVEQLAQDGFAIAPLRHGYDYPLVRWEPSRVGKGVAVGRIVGFSGFMPIAGMLASPNPWQSYLMGGLPESPVCEWPLPPALCAAPSKEGRIFDDPTHQNFSFFLALASRELWRTIDGYGLADPGAGAAIVITSRGVQGGSRDGDIPPIDRLWQRLVALLDRWEGVGCPSTSDYQLEFVPKREAVNLAPPPGREWVIERARHWEIVRLG
ncbi:MAG: hypothetical protein ABFD77_08540 [Thermotogota bacterium]